MKTQSTTRGFAILSAAGMAVKLLSLLYVPFLLHIIGEKGYAVYYAAYSVFVFIYIVTNTGMSSAIAKLVSELTAVDNPRDAVKTFKLARTVMLIIGTVMALIMVLFSKYLAAATRFPEAALAIAALAPAVLLTSVASVYRGYFQGKGNMTPTAMSQVLEQIANVIFSLLFATLWMRYGLAAACAGGTVGTTIGAFASVIYLIRYNIKTRPKSLSKSYINNDVLRYSNEEIMRRLLKYALPLTINWGLQNLGNLLDLQNTKGRLLTAGFSENDANIKYSYLAKYQTLVNVPITLISALCASILPLISGAAALNNREDIKRGIEYSYRTTLLVAIPSAVGLAVLSEPVFELLFPRYNAGAVLMKYGSVVLVFMAIVQVQSTILQSIGKLYLSTMYILIGITVKIALNYFLIAKPQINILGAIYGSMAGFLIPILLNNFFIKRTLRIKYNLISLAMKPLIAAAFMGIVVYIVQFDMEYILAFVNKGYLNNLISTFLSITAGALAYLYSLILIGGITQRDLQGLPGRVKKLIPSALLNRIR